MINDGREGAGNGENVRAVVVVGVEVTLLSSIHDDFPKEA